MENHKNEKEEKIDNIVDKIFNYIYKGKSIISALISGFICFYFLDQVLSNKITLPKTVSEISLLSIFYIPILMIFFYSIIDIIVGRWAALLQPRPEATGLTLTVEAPDTVITLADVAMGEVWIASGQSNMEFRLKDAANAAEVIPVCADSLLRFFTMRPAAVTNSGTWPAACFSIRKCFSAAADF